MNIRPIRNEEELTAALARLLEIFDAPAGTPEADERDVLGLVVHDYEERHYPMPPLDPITAIRCTMDERGLKQRDLMPFIGSESRVSEVLSGRRPLTLEMVRKLHEGLRIPLDCLIAPTADRKAS